MTDTLQHVDIFLHSFPNVSFPLNRESYPSGSIVLPLEEICRDITNGDLVARSRLEDTKVGRLRGKALAEPRIW
jgi:hypothetical protein